MKPGGNGARHSRRRLPSTGRDGGRVGEQLREHLTIPDREFQAKVDRTPAGMYGWAGGGPAGAVCFGCAHFDRPDRVRKPELARRCQRWVTWLRGAYRLERAPVLKVPPQTSACSAYQARG